MTEKKAVVIAANGCEEGETLTIVDILRRAEITCDIAGLGSTTITGSHGVTFRADVPADGRLEGYDMIILPGGYGGADNMRASDMLLSVLRKMDSEGKYIAAICAAALVLDKAGLLENRNFTCYPSTAFSIHSGTRLPDKIVIDGNLITSQGPATAYAFSYKLSELLGADASAVQKRMVYFNAFEENGLIQEPGTFPALAYAPCDKKAAVLMVEGYEESETVQIVDLLRRANVTTHTFRFQDDPYVLSMQGMYVKADRRFPDGITDYDLIIVPGGRTAGAKLIANGDVQETLKRFNEEGKLIGAMCSGTTVVHAAGVMTWKKVTGYTGYSEKLTGARFVDDVSVFDANLITSQGPATPYPFAFKLMEALGIDPEPMKVRLLYKLAGGK